MKHKRFVFKFSEKKREYLLIFCAVAALCFSQTAAAQSGRRSSKILAVPKPPVAAAPAADAQTAEPSVSVSSIIVAGEIQHDYAFFRSTYLDSTLKECIDSLKARPPASLELSKGGSMTFNEAKERAKKETTAFVLWMGFVAKDDGIGNMSIDYIEYALLKPQTAKPLTSGRVDPGQSFVVGQGGVLRLPSRPKRPSALSQMKAGAREIAGNLLHGGWL